MRSTRAVRHAPTRMFSRQWCELFPARNQERGRLRLDPRPEGGGTEQVAIGLRLTGRIGLDPEDGPRAEQHARVAAEVLPRQPPEDPDRVRRPSRTKDAQVQLSVILTDSGAE